MDVPKTYRKGAAAAEVCETLRTQILTLVLRPGDPLDETRLSEEFAVSRSPVREALNRLSAERLVVTLPNRGAVVAPINLEDFPAFIEALDLQQRYATRLAARHRSSAELAVLRDLAGKYHEAVRGFRPAEILQTNYDFHCAIAHAGRNPYVAHQYSELLSEARRMLHIHIEYLIGTDQQALLEDQHDDILDAIAARDVELADHLAHVHTMRFHDRFLRALSHNPDPAFRIEPERAAPVPRAGRAV